MCYEAVKTPEELYQYMKENIRYGFVNRNNEICIRKEMGDSLYEQTIGQSYMLQTPAQLLNNKCGICYDQVELIREWLLNHGYNVKTYYTPYHNHAILTYQDNEKFLLFERTIKEQNGIHSFDSLDSLLQFYLETQDKLSLTEINSLILYPYNEVNFGCGFKEFRENIMNNNQGQVLTKVKKR